MARPPVSADMADMRERVARIETLVVTLSENVEKYFEQREEKRREELETFERLVRQVSQETKAEITAVSGRLALVEKDLVKLKIDKAVLVKVASLGGLVATALAATAEAIVWAYSNFTFKH